MVVHIQLSCCVILPAYHLMILVVCVQVHTIYKYKAEIYQRKLGKSVSCGGFEEIIS